MAVLNDMLPISTMPVQAPTIVAVSVDPPTAVTTDTTFTLIVAVAATIASSTSFPLCALRTIRCAVGAAIPILSDVEAGKSILNFRPRWSSKGRFVRRKRGFSGRYLLECGGRVHIMSRRGTSPGNFPLISSTVGTDGPGSRAFAMWVQKSNSGGRLPASTAGGKSTLVHCSLHSMARVSSLDLLGSRRERSDTPITPAPTP